MKIFNHEFVKEAQSILQKECSARQSFFKKDFAELLGFNTKDPKNLLMGLNIITIMFDLGYFSDYKVVPGKNGGIFHISSMIKSVESIFPDNFLLKLFGALCDNCNTSSPISRLKLAKIMNFNLPEDQVCNLITVAIQKKYITGFCGKPGKNGGIIREVGSEPKLANESLAMTSAMSDEPALAQSANRPQDGSFWSSIEAEIDDQQHLRAI